MPKFWGSVGGKIFLMVGGKNILGGYIAKYFVGGMAKFFER